MNEKWVVYSKTIWVNLIVTAIAVFELIAQQAWIASNPSVVAVFVAIVGILNVVLRFITFEQISFEKPPASKWILIPLLFIPIMAASAFADDGGLPVRPTIAANDESQDGQVVETSTDRFHRALLKAAAERVKDGKMKRVDLVRLRVAMLSPAFRKHAEDLAVTQMAASGSENVPIGEDGVIDRASIDWDAILAFLKEFIPILMELIKAFSVLSHSPHDAGVACQLAA